MGDAPRSHVVCASAPCSDMTLTRACGAMPRKRMMQESTMNTTRPLPPVRIESIHPSPQSGAPLLLLPDRLLVRWPEQMTLPTVGDEVVATVVHVPMDLRDDVSLVLFARHPVERCD